MDDEVCTVEPMEDEELAPSGEDEELPPSGDGEAKVGLECDYSAYVLFHEGRTGAPCLSFDILKDNLGDNRNCDTPVTSYFITGSQAAHAQVNNITLMKMSNMGKLSLNDSDDESSDDEDDEARDKLRNTDLPVVSSALAKHNGSVNRIRATTINNVPVAATWSELGQVHIWDLSEMMGAVDDPRVLESYRKDEDHVRPIFTFNGHGTEGFAIDWAPAMPGTLATGDCSQNIHVWRPGEAGNWVVGATPFTSHTASIEDIQWSPNEPHVFASCSVDKSIKIWDARASPSKACQLTCSNAHDSDVNVIHWNHNEPFIVSGGDDGKVLVWDLRTFNSNTPVAIFKHHTKPVTTVEWHPSDASVLASGGEDDQILQWDLAVERDTEPETQQNEESEDVPEQLLFVHKGQQDVKELHWHSQVPGMIISTAHSGFNVFKTISC